MTTTIQKRREYMPSAPSNCSRSTSTVSLSRKRDETIYLTPIHFRFSCSDEQRGSACTRDKIKLNQDPLRVSLITLRTLLQNKKLK
jgi:hypothetical protein